VVTETGVVQGGARARDRSRLCFVIGIESENHSRVGNFEAMVTTYLGKGSDRADASGPQGDMCAGRALDLMRMTATKRVFRAV
jgi:hypothetical protein